MPKKTAGLVRQVAEKTIQAIEHIKSANYVSVYSNYAQAGYTPWDLRITFSETKEVGNDKVVFDDLVTVTLNPALALALVQVIQGNLQGYEAQYGKIKVPTAPTGDQEAKDKEADKSK